MFNVVSRICCKGFSGSVRMPLSAEAIPAASMARSSTQAAKTSAFFFFIYVSSTPSSGAFSPLCFSKSSR